MSCLVSISCDLYGFSSAEAYMDCQYNYIMSLISNSLLVLGLVDAHTHPVWAGDRVHEFAMKVNML